MLAKIATATELSRADSHAKDSLAGYIRVGDVHLVDLISRNVAQTVAYLSPIAVIIPTAPGHTARMVSRFKLPVWIAAVSQEGITCQGGTTLVWRASGP